MIALELDDVRMLLRGRDDILLEILKASKPRKFYHSHRKFWKQALKQKLEQEWREQESKDAKHFEPPQFTGKNEYLYFVNAKDGGIK